MEQYSIALALQDFMPVALSSIGLFYLAAGPANLVYGRTDSAFVPWAMGAVM